MSKKSQFSVISLFIAKRVRTEKKLSGKINDIHDICKPNQKLVISGHSSLPVKQTFSLKSFSFLSVWRKRPLLVVLGSCERGNCPKCHGTVETPLAFPPLARFPTIGPSPWPGFESRNACGESHAGYGPPRAHVDISHKFIIEGWGRIICARLPLLKNEEGRNNYLFP